MRLPDGVAAAAGTAAFAAGSLYVALVASGDGRLEAGRLALWAGTLAACGTALLGAAVAPSPRVRFGLLTAAAVVLAVVGTLAILSFGAVALLAAALAGLAALRLGAPDTATAWSSAAAGAGVAALFLALVLVVG